MITTFAPVMLDATTAGMGTHITVTASTLWDIGGSIKSHGITTAVWFFMGGTALVAAWEFLGKQNRTGALKAVAIGVLLIGLVANLPALGLASKDTVSSTVRGGGR